MTLRWRSRLVVLCAAVILFATSVEASHFHRDADSDAPLSKPFSKKTGNSCLICSALHAPALSAAGTVFGAAIATMAEAIPATPENPTRLKAFGLFVRPPPNMA